MLRRAFRVDTIFIRVKYIWCFSFKRSRTYYCFYQSDCLTSAANLKRFLLHVFIYFLPATREGYSVICGREKEGVCVRAQNGERKSRRKIGYINVLLSTRRMMSVELCRCESKHLVLRALFYILQILSTDLEMTNVEIKYTKVFINNEWHKAANGKTFPVINPSTGEEICQVEEGTRVSTLRSIDSFQTNLVHF